MTDDDAVREWETHAVDHRKTFGPRFGSHGLEIGDRLVSRIREQAAEIANFPCTLQQYNRMVDRLADAVARAEAAERERAAMRDVCDVAKIWRIDSGGLGGAEKLLAALERLDALPTPVNEKEGEPKDG